MGSRRSPAERERVEQLRGRRDRAAAALRAHVRTCGTCGPAATLTAGYCDAGYALACERAAARLAWTLRDRPGPGSPGRDTLF